MKTATGWQDVAIQNASAHGLKISATEPMRRGECVELRRASQIIVARVVWAQNGTYGLRTQDAVDIPALVNPNAAKAEVAVAEFQADRRARPRPEERAERSRIFAARFQWAAVGGAMVMAAGYLVATVQDVLSSPLSAVSRALGGASGEPQAQGTN